MLDCMNCITAGVCHVLPGSSLYIIIITDMPEHRLQVYPAVCECIRD